MSGKKYLIVMAAGHGTRMGGNLPKQFMQLDGKAILHQTILKLHKPKFQLLPDSRPRRNHPFPLRKSSPRASPFGRHCRHPRRRPSAPVGRHDQVNVFPHWK